MKQITAGSRQYELHNLYGAVLDCNKIKKSTTYHKKEYERDFYGRFIEKSGSTPITFTNNTDNISLRDKDGNEHTFNLTSFDIDCCSGHMLNIVWLNEKGRRTYIAVKNLDTNEKYFNSYAIIDMHKPSGILFLIIIIAFFLMGYLSSNEIFVTIISTLLTVAVCNKVYDFVARSGAKEFKRTFHFEV